MLDAVRGGHIIVAVLVERAVGSGIGAGEGILAAELVERAIALPRVTRILRNSDVGRLFHAAIGNGLLHLHPDLAGSGIGRNTPSGVFPAKRLLCELVFMALKVCASDGVERIVMNKPQMPRPNDCTELGNSNDGVAVLDFIGRHFELHDVLLI